MKFRVTYDARRTFSIAYGRVLYIEAETLSDTLAANYAAVAEGDATIEQVAWRLATKGEVARFEDLMRRQKLWLENVRFGKPNAHGDL